jgi:Bax protein
MQPEKSKNMRHPFVAARLAITLLTGILLVSCSPDSPGSADVDKPASTPSSLEAPEVIVVVGMNGLIERLKQEQWWGEVNRDEQLTVPHLMIAGIKPSWRIVAQEMPVQQKKAVFYRLMLPLVMHANKMVMDRRVVLLKARDSLAAGKELTLTDLELLKEGALLMRIKPAEEVAGAGSGSLRERLRYVALCTSG